MAAVDSPVVLLEEFLAPFEFTALRAFARAHEAAFSASHVIHGNDAGQVDDSHRRSRVLYDLGPFHALMGARIRQVLSHVAWRLGLPEFPVQSLELQLTASNDGDFFRPHCDNGDAQVQSRTLTFVYFAHREPCPFEGGELRVYGIDTQTGEPDASRQQAIRPAANAIAFFPSDRLHEITPVRCPGGGFMDSRFTLNGWLHR